MSGSPPDGGSGRHWLQTSPFPCLPLPLPCPGNVLWVPVLCPTSGHVLTATEITCVQSICDATNVQYQFFVLKYTPKELAHELIMQKLLSTNTAQGIIPLCPLLPSGLTTFCISQTHGSSSAEFLCLGGLGLSMSKNQDVI